MRSSAFTAFLSKLLILASSIMGTYGKWQVTYLLSHEMLSFGDIIFNSSITFSLERGGYASTNCSTNWVHWPTPDIPKQWIRCEDSFLRFRIAVFNDASNFTLEVVELAPVISNSKTTSIGVGRANITLSRASGIYCFGNTQAAGTQCELSEPPLTLTTSSSSFTPSPLNIIWSLSRSDGPQSGDIPCTEAWTFYIYDPNVSVLGPLTLGRGPEYEWQTHCDTTWVCGGKDNSINTWTNCAAPSFQFVKTLPTGGDTLSDFVMSIKHTFPLMMATSVRGSNASDEHLTDPEEVGGMEVALSLADTAWKDGKTLTPIMSGGIDQTGNCSIGCEFSGKQVNVEVVDMEIL